MSRRTALRIAAPILAIGLLVAVVVVGLRLATPAQPPGPAPGSTPLSTSARCFLGICRPRGTHPTATPCSSKATSTTVDGVQLQRWPACTAEGKAILGAYHAYMTTYGDVLTHPYGTPGETPRQILGNIYAQEAQGTLKATKIPPGCKIPTNVVHAVSWPAACDQLITPSSKPGTTGPLAWAATQLSKVATPSGVAVALHALAGNLDLGYATSGTLPALGAPVIRQVVSVGGSVFTNAPNPALPMSAWVPKTATAHTTTAVVWSCLTDRLVITDAAGHTVVHAPDVAVTMRLVRVGTAWRMATADVGPVTPTTTNGSPCGIAY